MSSEESITQILKNALSSDKETNNSAYLILEKMALESLSLFLYKLGVVLSTETNDKGIRQMAAVMMKNSLIHVEASKDIWREKIGEEDKSQIKKLVLSTLASDNKEVRKSASFVIASICKIEQPIDKYWSELIPSLTQNCFHSNLNLRFAAIQTLGDVCQEISQKGIDSNNVNTILNALIQNLMLPEYNKEIIETSLESMFHVIKFAEKNFSNEKEIQIIVSSIFGVVQKNPNDDDILNKVAMLLIEMISISSFYDYIHLFFTQLCDFTFHIITTKEKDNERLALLCLEIWCTLGDEELKRIDDGKIIVQTGVEGLQVNQSKQSQNYYSQMIKQLEKVIIDHVRIPSVDEDDSDWTISKACLYILSILVQVVHLEEIKEFFTMLNNQINFKTNDLMAKCKCWLLLAGSLSTIYKSEMTELLSIHLTRIIKDIDVKEDIRIQKTASFLLVKITKHFPKIIDPKKLQVVYTSVLQCLKHDYSVTVNVCQILQNLFKANGDINTVKNSNNTSPMFDILLSELFQIAVSEQVIIKQHKLSFNCLVTIGTLIDYSSHDKQETIYEALIAFLGKIEQTITNFNDYQSKGSTAENIFQIQDYFYTILRIMFKKYKKPIDYTLGSKIWLLTDRLFKFRNTVFEEANLALGSLAINMKEPFTEIFVCYWPFLEFSIKNCKESSLSKSGLTSLLNSMRSIGSGVNTLSESIIKVLIEVCTNTDVSRSNKTIAITCIGEIALKIGIEFTKYLSPVLSLLLSASQMAVTIDDPDDEETVEFIRSLQYELIQTFTCITFALDEKPETLIPFIPNIISFFKIVVSNTIAQKPEILKAILSFISDMVYLYGKEIKTICDQEFISDLIQKLRAFKIARLEEEISQQEELLKMLFKN